MNLLEDIELFALSGWHVNYSLLKIRLFLFVLGLPCRVRAPSSCASSVGRGLLTVLVSLVAHRP